MNTEPGISSLSTRAKGTSVATSLNILMFKGLKSLRKFNFLHFNFIKYAVIQKYFGVISNLHVPKKLHKLSKYTDQA